MGALRFLKYQGLGNDFLVVDATSPNAVLGAQAVALCDRRRGVGGDGVLLVLPPLTPGAAARMKVLNADGSSPEMCGNGLRCVALHVARSQPSASTNAAHLELVIDTDAGPRRCGVAWETPSPHPPDAAEIVVEMGHVRVEGEANVEALGRPFPLVLADAGNPHAVFLGELSRAEVERFGPALATHPQFPRGRNVEFVRQLAPARAEVLVWERGVGLTLACGTGACATAAVLAERGLAPRDAEITVELLGGPLFIRVAADGQVVMRGPARFVFAGEVP